MNPRPELTNIIDVQKKASRIKRFHTEFMLVEQTISDHVYHIFRIYYHIWGPPQSDLFPHLMFHDVEELFMGDIPHFSASLPKMKEAKQEIEESIANQFPAFPRGDHPLKYRVKVCDWIEALERMVFEDNLGNYSLRRGIDRLYTKLEKFMRDMPESPDMVLNYLEVSGLQHEVSLIVDGVEDV